MMSEHEHHILEEHFAARTDNPFPNSLRVRDRLQLVTVFQTRHTIRARGRSDGDNELIIPERT